MKFLFNTILSVILVKAIHGNIFECLDRCECDTNDETIFCHNGNRTQLTLPHGERLRGFSVIGITYNNIVTLPSEQILRKKFPELKIVDVKRNPNFDCGSLQNYSKLEIFSDCYQNVGKAPAYLRPNKACDFSCQVDAKKTRIDEYLVNLLAILKEKYQNFDSDSAMRDIKKFFANLSNKVNSGNNDNQAKIRHKRSLRTASNMEHVEVICEE